MHCISLQELILSSFLKSSHMVFCTHNTIHLAHSVDVSHLPIFYLFVLVFCCAHPYHHYIWHHNTTVKSGTITETCTMHWLLSSHTMYVCMHGVQNKFTNSSMPIVLLKPSPLQLQSRQQTNLYWQLWQTIMQPMKWLKVLLRSPQQLILFLIFHCSVYLLTYYLYRLWNY